MSTAGRERIAAWVIDSLRPGGAEQLALALRAAPPPGWRIELLALQAGNAATGAPAPVRTLAMRHGRDRRTYGELEAWLGCLRPALIHSHLRYATIWGGRAAARLGIPHWVTLHVAPSSGGSWREQVGARWERHWLARANQRIFVSASQRDRWRRCGIEGAVLANGVAAAAAWSAAERRVARQRLGLAAAGRIVVTVAVVRRAKGWQEWVRAAEVVTTREPGTWFVWVGGGDELARLQAAVAASPARHRILLAGQQTNVADWLRASDLFLFPTHGEALPTALIEAMAQRLPVVATDIAPNREVLGGAGILVAPGDAAALARAVLAPVAAGQAEAAFRRWQEKYSFDAWRARLGAAYDAGGLPRTPARPRVLMPEFFGRGGLFHYSWQMARGLAQAGAEITLLSGPCPEARSEENPRVEARLWTWDPQQDSHWLSHRLARWVHGVQYLAAWGQICATAARRRPELVLLGDLEHRCDAAGVRMLRWLQRRRGARLAVIWHNLEPFERRSGQGVVVAAHWRRRMARDFDAVFVHGSGLARRVEQEGGIRATAIAHGNQDWILEQAGADPGLRQRFALDGRPLGLLFGTLSRYKGVEVLLDALARVPTALRPQVLIAGRPMPGVEPEAWQAQVRRLGLERDVMWDLRVVPTAEIAWYFQLADWVVLPYLAASQSGVGHLALSAGKALIVSRCGALPDLVDGNGVVVEPGDAAALGQAMDRVSRDRALCRSWGERSRALARGCGWNGIAAAVLAQALPSAPRPRLAYILSRYPLLSETFILREMSELVRQGEALAIYPLHTGSRGRQHAAVAQLEARVWRAPWWGLRAHAHWLRRGAWRYASTLAASLWHTRSDRNLWLGALAYWHKALAIARQIEREGIEHVHAHYATHPAWVAWVVRQLTGVPYSFTVHAHDLYCHRAMLPQKLAAAAGVVTISRFNRAQLKPLLPQGAAPRLEVIRCGVRAEAYGGERTEPPAAAAAELRLLSVGSLQPYKGHRHLIAAGAMLRTLGVRFRCRLIGGGPLRRSLEAQIQRLGLADVVWLSGPAEEDEVRRALQATDVFVLPSVVDPRSGQMEGVPVALMEAMAAEVPVIASRLSGVPELITDGISGLLVTPEDEAGLAAAIVWMADHADARGALGTAGRRQVQAEYGLSANVQQLRRFFRGIGGVREAAA